MIDVFDKKILALLQSNARISNLALAEKIGLSTSATLRRVQKLEQKGWIKGYTAIFNEKLLNLNTQVILRVTLSSQEQQKLQQFEDNITQIPNVLACYLIGGDYDYLVRIVVMDINDYEKLYKNKLSKLPYVHRLQSNFALKEVVRRVSPIVKY